MHGGLELRFAGHDVRALQALTIEGKCNACILNRLCRVAKHKRLLAKSPSENISECNMFAEWSSVVASSPRQYNPQLVLRPQHTWQQVEGSARLCLTEQVCIVYNVTAASDI